MHDHTLTYLLWLAAFTGAVHTLMGPDHYVPFIAMARAGGWSLLRTLAVTVVCGVGHVLGSVALGTVGIAAGWAIGGLEAFESTRGEIAAWLLLGFGLAYTVWGVRRAMRHRPHTHWHTHDDGTVHRHAHAHDGAAAAHELGESARPRTMTFWVLFTVFVFGPCEVLIPQLMYPAARHGWGGLAAITAVFAAATIGTMTTVVAAAYAGLTRLALPNLEKYSHATAGLAVTMCGLAIKLGL